MLQVIKKLLLQYVDDIDAGNSNISFEDQCKVIRIMSNIGKGQELEMNKTQAADYIGVCRATFDNYVKDGLIPKGEQVGNFKELRWYKCDLDLFLNNQ